MSIARFADTLAGIDTPSALVKSAGAMNVRRGPSAVPVTFTLIAQLESWEAAGRAAIVPPVSFTTTSLGKA